ncbi:MAG: hypothetical protein HKN32_05140, partial [Flavobacteriales bacterium]|nr:hypothetical protein [Flavobacteriales bacterium]
MRYLLTFMTCLTLFACNTTEKLAALKKSNEERCLKLMEIESQASGDYSQKRDFFRGLIFECREPDSLPYPRLRELMDEMSEMQRKIITTRGLACSVADSMLIDVKGRQLKSKKLAAEALFDKAESALHQKVSEYEVLASEFQALKDQYGIVKIQHSVYAESLQNRLISWQDTLMLQGTLIAASQRELDNSKLQKGTDEYVEFYGPISQMQLLHKQTQQKITSVENQENRYSSGPQEASFYLGPHLVVRHDYNASEKLFVDLIDIQF